jgi:predicted NBD/HSP70 family sugar kinase
MDDRTTSPGSWTSATGPATPALLRTINDRSALELLLDRGPQSRIDIGRLTGLSKPTASQMLARLEASGRVVRVGMSSGRPGPAAQLYDLNPVAGYAAAADVTPTRATVVISDLTGRIVGESTVAMRRQPVRHPAERLAEALHAAAHQAGITAEGVGTLVIGLPGAFDESAGRLRYAAHMPGWHDKQLLGRLAETLQVPFRLENDVNLAALAEQRSGAARGCADFVYCWAGEGIGAAIMLDGRLRRGATGGAGEIGFMPVPGASLVRRVTRANAGGFHELAGRETVMQLARSCGVAGRTAEDVVAAAAGEQGADGGLLDQLATRYATGLASVVSVLDPPLVVLAGSVLRAGGEPLRARVARELSELAMVSPALVVSTLEGSPVLVGAQCAALDLVRDHVFSSG